MMLFRLTSSNMIVNFTPVYAVECDEGRVATEDETYYATGFHSQSSDRHFSNLKYEFDFKIVVGYTFEKKPDSSREYRSLT